MNLFIYLAGWVGLFAVGAIPPRSWSVMRKVVNEKRGASFFLMVVIVSAAVAMDVVIVSRIFTCLTQPYCGPGVASGWIYLATLGSAYVLFEVAILALRTALPPKSRGSLCREVE